MEFGIEKYDMLMMKSEKDKQQKELNKEVGKALERSQKKKITSSWEYKNADKKLRT